MNVKRITTSTAGRYAYSLHQVTVDNEDKIKQDFEILKSICNGTIDKALSAPEVQRYIVNSFLEIITPYISQQFANFIKIVIYNGKYGIVNDIERMYIMLCDERRCIQSVVITSAVELTNQQKERLINKLAGRYNKNVSASYKIDPSIIAGIIVTTDHTRIDMSLKNELDQLSNHLKGE